MTMSKTAIAGRRYLRMVAEIQSLLTKWRTISKYLKMDFERIFVTIKNYILGKQNKRRRRLYLEWIHVNEDSFHITLPSLSLSTVHSWEWESTVNTQRKSSMCIKTQQIFVKKKSHTSVQKWEHRSFSLLILFAHAWKSKTFEMPRFSKLAPF